MNDKATQLPLDSAFKKRLIAYCIQIQEDSYDQARKAMEEAQAEANAYGPPKDRYDGFRNQQLRKGQLIEKQAATALNNIKALNLIDEHLNDVADFGTLVLTDKLLYFIAIGIGIVKFEGMSVAVISPNVPVFSAMKGRRSGDSFSFNGVSYLINQII